MNLEKYEKAIYYTLSQSYNPVCFFEYSDKKTFTEIISCFQNNINIVSNFAEKKHPIYNILLNLSNFYDELLLDKVNKIYIVNRKDCSICLINKQNIENVENVENLENVNAIIKMDALFTEIFFDKNSNDYLINYENKTENKNENMTSKKIFKWGISVLTFSVITYYYYCNFIKD